MTRPSASNPDGPSDSAHSAHGCEPRSQRVRARGGPAGVASRKAFCRGEASADSSRKGAVAMTIPGFVRLAATSVLTLAFLGGCGGGSHSVSGTLPATLNGGGPKTTNAAASKIKHIVYIVQENRSFDNL